MIIKTLSAPTEELFGICARAARLSHKSIGDNGGPEDVALLKKLVARGDEHAKAVRGLMVYAFIEAPRYIWQEMDTYRVGTEPLGSESTMHSQKLEGAELLEYKGALTEGTYQARIWVFSYQALRHIYFQRKNHRLPQWRTFCKWVEGLPNSEVITVEDSRITSLKTAIRNQA